jgi:hypothetical protein
VQIFKDARADRMKAALGRINGMGTLPYGDKGILNQELRRIVDLGVKGIVLPDCPERLSEGYIGRDGKVSPFWEELFDVCNANCLPINFHRNASLDANYAIWDDLGWINFCRSTH